MKSLLDAKNIDVFLINNAYEQACVVKSGNGADPHIKNVFV